MIYTGKSWSELGIDIPSSKLSLDRNIKIKRCPKCLEHGKKKDNDNSLSVVPGEGIGKCHKCESVFRIVTDEPRMVEYKQPSRVNMTQLSDAGLKLFTDRKLSQDAVNKHKIVQEKGSIVFPYLNLGQFVNAKYRGIAEKRFYQSAGAKQIMYNMDNVRAYWSTLEDDEDRPLIIVEGEFDSLAWETAGIPYSTSVSQGAPNVKDENVDKKLECITNSYDLFDEATTIYIGVDKDPNGERLARELIRRFPHEKVQLVDYGEHKDANDYLRWEGIDKLKELLGQTTTPKIDGVFTADDSSSQLMEYLHKGLPKGTTTHFPSVDKHWKWRADVNIVAGYNNEGKTLMTLQLAMVKAVRDGWKFAIFSPENLPPAELWEDMAHTFTGKTMDIDAPERTRMTEAELIKAINFLKKHFFLVSPDEKANPENLLKTFATLVQSEGVRGIIIDPYNQVEHRLEPGETENLYASRFMSMLKKFQIQYDVCIIMIMHIITTRVGKDEDYPEPDKYGIKGGGTFSDKADNVNIIWRPSAKTAPDDATVVFKADKIKKVKLTGHRGSAYLSYDWKTNRYLDPLLGGGKSPLELTAIESLPTQDNFFDDKIGYVDSTEPDEIEDELPF